MAKFNWGGAAAGLLGGVAMEAKAHEKRLNDLEEQRIADERQTRREEALLAKQMAMSKYQADLQSARDDVNWKRGQQAEDKRYNTQRADKEEDYARIRDDQQADRERERQWKKEDLAALERRGGPLAQQYKDMVDVLEIEPKKALEYLIKKDDGTLTEHEKRKLYNDAFSKGLALFEPQPGLRGEIDPEALAEAERKAREHAVKISGFNPDAGEVKIGLLASHAQAGPAGHGVGAGDNNPMPMPKSKSEMIDGQTYMTKRGPAVWRNGAFHTR